MEGKYKGKRITNKPLNNAVVNQKMNKSIKQGKKAKAKKDESDEEKEEDEEV